METAVEAISQANEKSCAICKQPADSDQHCNKCRTLRQQVMQGSQILDERRPGWPSARRLKLDTLDMEFYGLCLLSQLFGSFEKGIQQLDIGPLGIEMRFAGLIDWGTFGWEYGYTLHPSTPEHERHADFARLTTIWKAVITARRLAVAQLFQLVVHPLPGGTCKLMVLQRPYPFHQYGKECPLSQVGSICEPALSSARDLILEELRANHYRPATLQSKKEKHLDLCEESGVRLSTLFQVLSLVTCSENVALVQQTLWAMSNEELLYWFSKCSGPDGHRGVHALHILCGGEE